MGPVAIKNAIVAYVDHLGSVRKSLFFALGRLLQENGFHLVHVDSATRGTEGALEYAAEEGFAAAVVWSKTGFPEAERVKTVQRKMPVIAVDHGLRNVPTDLVVCDNHEGARMAVSHLAKQGRKRIAISGMFDNLDVNHERFSGYIQALFDHGLEPNTEDFLFTMTSGMPQHSTRLLELRLKDHDRPDAIFVLQDMSVPTVMRAVLDAGLRIPDDIAVVGFDNDVPIQIGGAGLTTVAPNVAGVADGCMSLIKNRLSNPIAPFERLSLPVDLIVRGSCGAPKTSWVNKPYYTSEGKVGPGMQSSDVLIIDTEP
jgi:LacI family transcriptional regulator